MSEEDRVQHILQYCKRHEKTIFVRAIKDGRWQSVALADLDAEQWARNIARWICADIEPVRIVEPGDEQ